MKKIVLLSFLFVFSVIDGYAQTVINNPQTGLSLNNNSTLFTIRVVGSVFLKKLIFSLMEAKSYSLSAPMVFR